MSLAMRQLMILAACALSLVLTVAPLAPADVPTERLVKDGAASRSEATDAAMGQRAECVMLNKGPHLVDAIAFLDDVLRRMDRHQHKKSARLGSLGSWSEPQTL